MKIYYLMVLSSLHLIYSPYLFKISPYFLLKEDYFDLYQDISPFLAAKFNIYSDQNALFMENLTNLLYTLTDVDQNYQEKVVYLSLILQ